MHAVRARSLAILALLLVVLPLGAVGRDHYFCRMAGKVMDSCCCESTKAVELPRLSNPTPKLDAQDCCQLLERTARDGAPALREGTLQVHAPAFATVATPLVVAIVRPSYVLGREPAQARAPPRAGPTIYLKNCSLLT